MFRVVIVKPSKYGVSGYVDRYRWGFMPNSTLPYIRSMTPLSIDGVQIETHAIDEYVQTGLGYLDLIRNPETPTLLALVGVQSHQFQRSLDLAAFARAHGVKHCVIGGPHPMTCDTSALHNRGVSFAMAEAEMIWMPILKDAIHGELRPVYGNDQRWSQELHAPVLQPPAKRDMRRYVVPMLGLYPARGCPFTCNFCSVIKIAGHQIRSQSIETTIASLRAAKKAGIRLVMFTSDNFNKYAEAKELLEQMIAEKIRIPFFVQCDTQIAKQEEFVALLGKAGCFEMFIGVESFSRQTLIAARKSHNHPKTYGEIVRLCRKYRVASHFSNMIGFPEDTAKTIEEHLHVLRAINPDMASFYILTPIPGTQQYDEFLQAGWINEPNLDRYDGTTPTWMHPSLTPGDLNRLLYQCYRKFLSARHILGTAFDGFRPRMVGGYIPYAGNPLFSRFSAGKKEHPMSGGVSRVRVDSVSDYIGLRRSQYGMDLLPLPKSLELSRADAELNRRVARTGGVS